MFIFYTRQIFQDIIFFYILFCPCYCYLLDVGRALIRWFFSLFLCPADLVSFLKVFSSAIIDNHSVNFCQFKWSNMRRQEKRFYLPVYVAPVTCFPELLLINLRVLIYHTWSSSDVFQMFFSPIVELALLLSFLI